MARHYFMAVEPLFFTVYLNLFFKVTVLYNGLVQSGEPAAFMGLALVYFSHCF